MKLSTDCQPIVMHTLRIVIIGRLVFAFLTSNPTIFRVPHFKSDHFAGFGGFSQLTAGFWWVFAAYGWVFRLACWVFLPYGWVFRWACWVLLPYGCLLEKKNCFFRLGFLNKNQLGRAGSSFLRKRYINTIPSLLWKSKKKSFVWFLLIKPSRKKLLFCEKPAVRQ